MPRIERLVIAGGLLVAMVVGSRPIRAGQPPVLTVPAAKTRMQLVVESPRPSVLSPDVAWRLVEAGGPDGAALAQRIPALAADGTVAPDAWRLAADLPAGESASGLRRFRLEPAKDSTAFRFEEIDGKSLRLVEGDRPVMAYNFGTITGENVPESDPRRRRACYIHPLWGLNGEILTDDFPADHFHHHGVFWTWPHVGVDGQEHDLWAGDSIEDRFVGWICRETGPVAAILAVENGWFVGPKKVMIERVWMRVFKASAAARAIDLEFTWIPVGGPISLRGADGKSYGGLTLRMNAWPRTDAVVTVPGGRIVHDGRSLEASGDLHNARLPWADFSTVIPGCARRSGAAVFVHPRHPDYPPTWLTRCYGALCVGWPGVEARSFEPGVPIRLCYRILVHQDALPGDALTDRYQAYVRSTRATWQQ